jgi:hypothetical protein
MVWNGFGWTRNSSTPNPGREKKLIIACSCCIDKTSSAELSEAINSMFRWYKNAAVCYVYLSDVSRSDDLTPSMSKSRWFTRGWTLQELLAPSVIVFYSAEWQHLGTKSQLSRLLLTITFIEEEYLRGKDLQLASVAKRMSWSSRRNTSRIEDIAYCLLGIFDIHMPLIYGEGKKAFQRLQGEILKATPHDHTLYAWGTTIEWDSSSLPLSLYSTREFESKGQGLWTGAEADSLLKGMIAESPRDFENSHHFIPDPEAGVFHRGRHLNVALPQLINHELRIELPIMRVGGVTRPLLLYHWKRPALVQVRPTMRVVLLCGHEKLRDSLLVLPLKSWGSENFGRTEYLMLYRRSLRIARYPFSERILSYVAPEQEMVLQNGDFLFREPLRFALKDGVLYNGDGIRYLSHCAVIRADSSRSGYMFDWCIRYDGKRQRGWSIKFSRAPSSSSGLGLLTISLIRVSSGEERQVVDSNDGCVWFKVDRGHEEDIEFCKYAMGAPRDTWIPKGLPFHLKVGVERVAVSCPAATVDVVDIVGNLAEYKL